ncbi:multiple epidermal growth factor-like domains protein 10 [Drosophila montana]|uniref:multiple epidermal growth factor-like domains protein 10 n=1 Tax=Drosophila montana TaxID=40370 RepID=UPI00313DE76A
MRSHIKIFGLLIICLTLSLPKHTFGQFWKLSQYEIWKREMLASRESGICYKTQLANTLNPELRQRQISYCCDGYVNRGSSEILKCEPICAEDCSHGICLSPGYCECAPGYNRERAQCRKHGD